MKKLLLLFLTILLFIPLISFSQESDDAQSKINNTYVEGFFNSALEKVKIRGLLKDDGTITGYGDNQISIQFMAYDDYIMRQETYVNVEIKTPSGELKVIEFVKLKNGNFYFTDWVQKKQSELKKILVVNGVYKFSITKGFNWEFELTLKNL
jgi:hypothetical protein